MISIRKDSFKDVLELKKNLKLACSSIKQELDMHLDTLNQNTTEIESAYDYLSEIDAKLEKLNERVERIEMFLRPDMFAPQFTAELSHREQEVFLLLYTSDEGMPAAELGKRLGFTVEMVEAYITNIIAKGIPILKKVQDKIVYYMEQKFKELQAKKNVVKVSPTISVQLLKEKAL